MPHRTDNSTTLQSYEAFRDYLYLIGSEVITEEELQELYEKPVVISYNGHSVSIPFDAVIYNSLVQLIETQIKEY